MKKITRLSVGMSLTMPAMLIASSCSSINVKQIAYEVLSQEDCRINQLDDFCTRSFAHEYYEYERLRQDYLRSQDQSEWRVSLDETRLFSDSTLD